MNQKTTVINKLILGIVALTIFVTPLFFLPITPDFYNWNKQTFLLASGCLLIVLWAIKNVIWKSSNSPESEGKGPGPSLSGPGPGEFGLFSSTGLFSPPLLALVIVTLASTFLNPAYMNGLLGRGMLFIALFLIYFVISQTVTGSSAKFIIYPIIASAMVLAIISILQFLGLFKEIIPWPWMKIPNWTPAGSQFSQAALLVVALSLSVTKLLKFVFGGPAEEKSRESAGPFPSDSGEFGPSPSSLEALAHGIAIPILLASLTIFVSDFVTAQTSFSQTDQEISPEILQKSGPFLQLPFASGWRVASRVLGEDVKSAFLGFGPESFTPAFLAFKSIRLSRTPLWNIAFPGSSNEPLHLLTTLGMLGFGLWFWLFARFAKSLALKIKSGSGLQVEEIGLAVVLLMQIVLPPNLLAWFLLFALAGVNTLPERGDFRSGSGNGPAPSTLLLIVGLAIMGLLYLAGRAYAGELKLYQSLKAIDRSDGAAAYNLQLEAIGLNPKKADYHRIFSQTNLLLAQSLMQQINTAQEQTEGPSSEAQERQARIRNDISALIQQSIDEAKIATQLAPNNTWLWQNLAEIYRSLGGMLDGALDWAVGAYDAAINLDPLNPNLRINRGGIFYAAQDWEEAIISFRTAAQIRPTFANGWYNLAAAYRESGQFEKAAGAMRQTLKVLPTDAPDRPRAEKELQDIEEKIPETRKIESPAEGPELPTEEMREATPSTIPE